MEGSEVVRHDEININLLSIDELSELSELSRKYHFLLPKDSKLKDFVCNLFWLREYLKLFHKPSEIFELKKAIYEIILGSGNLKFAIETWLLKNTHEKIKNRSCYIEASASSANNEVVQYLKEREIIGYISPHGYSFTHDILEDLVLEKIIEKYFQQHMLKPVDFFKIIGDSFIMPRIFREFLIGKLKDNNEDVKAFIRKTLGDSMISFDGEKWKDAILTAALSTDYSIIFLNTFQIR